jgi:hypothetical protein
VQVAPFSRTSAAPATSPGASATTAWASASGQTSSTRAVRLSRAVTPCGLRAMITCPLMTAFPVVASMPACQALAHETAESVLSVCARRVRTDYRLSLPHKLLQ